MLRHAKSDLTNWKVSKNRKPLIILGAQQVGKMVFNEKYRPKFSLILSGRPPSESANANGVTTNVQLPLYLAHRAWKYTD